MSTGRRVALVVGEESGDARAASVVRALQELAPDLTFFGLGGPRLQRLCQPPFANWIAEAGVVGLWDVLKKYTWFRARFAEIRTWLLQTKPTAIVFVDYPGFNLRLAKALRPLLPHTRFIYYISPQVWAWNRGRIPRMARFLDAMLCLFPFEVPLYEASGLPALCVGHPLAEEIRHPNPALPRQEDLLGLFPGSRVREVHKLFPVMLEACQRMLPSHPELRFVAAAARPSLRDWMEAEVRRTRLPVQILTGEARAIMQQAAFAWVCSGTATLEAALLGLPHAIVYKTSWLTYEVGRRVIRVPHLGMVNILAGREVAPEFIQNQCQAFQLADCALRYLNDPAGRAELAEALRSASESIGQSAQSEAPSVQAARAILRVLDGQALLTPAG